MKKTLALGALVLIAGLALGGTAAALNFDVTYTADNVVGAWFLDGSSLASLPLGANAGNWRVADTKALTLAPDTAYQIVWQVENILTAGTGNPGAFMAEISPAGLLADSTLALSSAIWEVAVDYGSQATGINDPNLVWRSATAYGANNDSSTIWWRNNSGPVAGIDGNAQWIWGPDNFGKSGAPDEGDSVYIRVAFKTVSIPDASTLFLLGSACLIGFGGMRRRIKG